MAYYVAKRPVLACKSDSWTRQPNCSNNVYNSDVAQTAAHSVLLTPADTATVNAGIQGFPVSDLRCYRTN